MAISGKTGTLNFDEDICIVDWSINISTDIVDTTPYCSHNGWRGFTRGLKEADGTFNTFERVSTTDGSATFSNSDGGVNIIGEIIITQEAIGNILSGAQSFVYSFKFVEEPTIT